MLPLAPLGPLLTAMSCTYSWVDEIIDLAVY